MHVHMHTRYTRRPTTQQSASGPAGISSYVVGGGLHYCMPYMMRPTPCCYSRQVATVMVATDRIAPVQINYDPEFKWYINLAGQRCTIVA